MRQPLKIVVGILLLGFVRMCVPRHCMSPRTATMGGVVVWHVPIPIARTVRWHPCRAHAMPFGSSRRQRLSGSRCRC